jgi:predicted acyl esterase
LPFYYNEEVEVQKSFLDAFLKGEDRVGWSVKGKLPPVDMCIRKGDPGFNNAKAEAAAFPRRTETEWPIARTQYTKYHLNKNSGMSPEAPKSSDEGVLSYEAHGYVHQDPAAAKPKPNDAFRGHQRPDDTLEARPTQLQFSTTPFDQETEITGHVTTTLSLSTTKFKDQEQSPGEIDVFVTLRHVGPDGKEIFYTGTAGDPVPLTKGWLRASMRKINTESPQNEPWCPYREYLSTDVQPVVAGEVYKLDIEVWPTSCVVEKGGRIVFEVSSEDSQGSGIFRHDSPDDRYVSIPSIH